MGKYTKPLQAAVIGATVVIATPLLTPNLIPELWNAGVITLGQIVSGGLAAIGGQYLAEMFIK